MENVGVEAVVNGLTSFLSNMGKIDKSIKGLVPSNNLLKYAFEGVGNVISWLTGSVFRILEYTLGNLLASAIQKVVGLIQDMVAGALESADVFQKLEVRLTRLNFNSLRDSGMEYSAAMEQAVKLTQEQLQWAVKLGAVTPYDAKDISNIFTLARGYGFSNEEAKGLTESVIQFTAGMGLSNVELERVIVNFGQLRQQGKLNSQDLRDLARGAFVPINKILEIAAGKLGVTIEEFNALRKSGKLGAEGVDAFNAAFQELVGTDFEGSAEALGNVFSVAQKNVTGLIQDLLGMYVIGPVLFMVGSHIQDITDAIADNDERWNSLVGSVQRVGESISRVVGRILGLGPSTDSIADGVVSTLDKIALWFENNEDNIVEWVSNGVGWIKEELIPALEDVWYWLFGKEGESGAIEGFSNWLRDEFIPRVMEAADWVGNVFIPFLRDDLVPVFGALIELGSEVGLAILEAFGKEPNTSLSDFIHDTLIPAINDLTSWVHDNRDTISKWIKWIMIAYAAWTIFVGVIHFVISIFLSLLGTIIKLVTFIGSLGTAAAGLGLIITSVVTAAILGVITAIDLFNKQLEGAPETIKRAVDKIVDLFLGLKTRVLSFLSQTISSAKSMDWKSIGVAIVNGIINGLTGSAGKLAAAAAEIAISAYNSAKDALGIQSPSKLFSGIGENVALGFAEGILSMRSVVDKAFQSVSSGVLSVASDIPTKLYSSMAPTNSVTNTTNNNYSLTINSNARSESVVADFTMMQALG